MFDRKWRLRCESLEQEVSRLGQEKSAMQRELDELRSLHQQSQQERNELNGVTRYQHELHGKLSRFEDSLSQTRDGVVAQAEQTEHGQGHQPVHTNTEQPVGRCRVTPVHG